MLFFYECYTLFDITHTGISSHKSDKTDLDIKRNQQRNFDTMLQIISMRTQPFEIQSPVRIDMDVTDTPFGSKFEGVQSVWNFSFGVETKDVFLIGTDPVAALMLDSDWVPMSTGLTETTILDPACISTSDQTKNTYFIAKKLR